MSSAPFYISPFRLGVFETCPKQYQFAYIERLAETYRKPRPYFTMGQHVHDTLKDLMSRVPPGERTVERAEAILREKWRRNREGFSDVDDERRWGEKALRQVRAFLSWQDVAITPWRVEETLNVLLTPEIKLGGRVDRIDREDGGLVVKDYKTGRFHAGSAKPLQILLYATGVRKKFREPIVRALYLFLEEQREVEVPVGEGDLALAEEELAERVEVIRQESRSGAGFAPRPNRLCGSCDFLEICPARAEAETAWGGEPVEEELPF